MKIFKKSQKGEITTLMVLLGIGIMAVGIVAGKKLVEVGTRFLPKAQETENLALAGGAGPGTYEEDSRYITYEPTSEWERVFNKDASGNYFQRSNTPLSTATFIVNGDALDIYLRRSASAGRAGIYIDGDFKPIVDLYQSSHPDFGKYSFDLTSGKHNYIKIEVRQTKNKDSADYNVGLDKFEVRVNPTPTPTPTRILIPTPTLTMTPTPTITSTPTPTTTPSTTPTPTPTVSPTPTPSRTPTPTMTSTPTPTSTPTLTPTLTPTITPTLPPILGLVGSWGFDGVNGVTSSTVVDSSGHGNNGTWYGNGTHWGSPGILGDGFGVFGGSATTDFVLVPDSDSLDLTTALTISAWVKLDTNLHDSEDPIVAKGYYADDQAFALEFGFINPVSLRFYKSIGGYSACQWYYGNLLSFNNWYYLTVVYSGNSGTDSSVKFYLNGENKYQCNGSFPSALPTNNHELSVGSKQSLSGNYDINFAGKIDELKIFNRALSQDEIRVFYGQVISPTPTPIPPGNGTGLRGEYYDNMDLTNLKLARIDAAVNFNWGSGSPDLSSIAADTFSVRWSGQVQPRYNETYTFYTRTDDGVRLWVNNQLLVDKWVNQSGNEWSGTIALVAGQKNDIRMEYFENGGGASATLSWSSPSQAKEIIPQSQLDPAGDISPTSTPTPTPSPDAVPVGLWAFDEGSGNTVADSSGNANNGTWSGTGNHWVDGRDGKAGNFNGTDDSVKILDTNILHSDNFTAVAWFKKNTSSLGHLLGKEYGPGGDDSYVIWFPQVNKIAAHTSTSGVSGYVEYTSILDNQWYHVAFIKSGTSTSLYINGSKVSTASVTNATVNFDNSSVFIGADDNDNNDIADGLFSGLIDNVRIYNYALSDQQVVEDMNLACTRGDLGNLNCDQGGLINETDLSILLANWRPTGSCTIPTPTPLPSLRSADITGDCKVDESDLSKLLDNWKTQ